MKQESKKVKKDEVMKMESMPPKQLANSIDMANSLEEKRMFAEQMIKSGLLPATLATPDHLDDEDLRDQAIGGVIAIVEYGRELKISPWVALHGMHVVQGKVVMGVHMYLGLASKAGLQVNVERDYEKVYKGEKLIDIETEVSITKWVETPKGPEKITNKFIKRWSEIKKAGLDTRDNYVKRGPLMLRTRCLTEALRLYAADLYMGTLEKTEMLDVENATYTVDIEGEVVE